MAHANPAIHAVQPATSAHSSAQKNRLMGKPRFHFEPQEVMQPLLVRLRAMPVQKKVIIYLMKLRLRAVTPAPALCCLLNWKKPLPASFVA